VADAGRGRRFEWLVTSDHPVCLRWMDGHDHGNISPGFAVPGTEVIFPLFRRRSPCVADSMARRTSSRRTRKQLPGLTACSSATVTITSSGATRFSVTGADEDEIGSGTYPDTDEVFLAGGEADFRVCRYCSLIPGPGVKLSNDRPCRAHCSLRGRGKPSA
jgi:hypothetical protein